MKLDTIQKRDKLNLVRRMGEPGPGGAYHDYAIELMSQNGNDSGEYVIEFQRGPRKDPNARHGVLDEDLLEIVRDRMRAFQAGEFATRENALALTHIEEALLWLNKRKEDRAARGVLGTYEK